jgi:hypothetical protein
MRIKRLLVCLLVVLFLGGCVYWARIESPYLAGPQNAYKLEVPVGWMHAAYIKSLMFITKDGPELQFIQVAKFTHKDAFKAIEVEISKDTLVSELAEYYVANYKKLREGLNVTHVETRPATISGHSGFRSHLEFVNARGLVFDIVVYGFANEDGFYELVYQAPRLHYFERDLPAFEALVQSFTLLS